LDLDLGLLLGIGRHDLAEQQQGPLAKLGLGLGAERLGLVEELAQLRADAMITKDFAPVDALKSALTDAGVEVRMSKAGVELLPGPGFDPAKLESLK
jgi:cysteinyl-tRNA synthetase